MRSLLGGLGIACSLFVAGADPGLADETYAEDEHVHVSGRVVASRRSGAAERGVYHPPVLVRPALGAIHTTKTSALPEAVTLPVPPMEIEAQRGKGRKLSVVPIVIEPTLISGKELGNAYFADASDSEQQLGELHLPVGFEASDGAEGSSGDGKQAAPDFHATADTRSARLLKTASVKLPEKSAAEGGRDDQYETTRLEFPTVSDDLVQVSHWQEVPHVCDELGSTCGCDVACGCDTVVCDSTCDGAGPFSSSGRQGVDHWRWGVLLGGTRGYRRPWQQEWFGNAEYLLWARRGQDLPILAQASPGSAIATSLFGGEGRMGESSESGGRFTIGRWLDDRQTHALVGRFWGVGREEHDFFVDESFGQAIGIPFDQAVPPQSTFYDLISSPADAGEFLSIGLSSEVYGGDIAIRQRWREGLGGRIDFLWGYQFMRVSESLGISGNGTNNFGVSRSVTESFDIENEFHGGQLGMALHYEECGWTFDGLFKVGLGGIERRAALQTQSNIGAGNEGYFVYPSNAGTSSDTEFAVMPELSLGLGYALNPNIDFTVGYTYVMLSDVIQIDGMIDTTIDTAAVPTTGHPSRNFKSNDYWLHGVHFGVAINY